jgi:CubicO group peptidase (beta-lactamase class C family)
MMMSAPWRRVVWSLFFVAAAPPLVAQGLPSARPEEVGLSSAALDSIPAVLGRYVESKKMAGAVVAVARHGKLAYLRAVGFMDVDSAKPMRTDAIFRIMSMTKPIVTVGAMRLVERGRLSLDDPVAKYIPAFGMTPVYAGGASSAPQLSTPDRPMTIRDLMRHTSGLTYGVFTETPPDSIIRRAAIQGAAAARGWTLEQTMDTLAHLPLAFSPGSGWSYGLSVDALARVLEVVSGKSLDRFLDDEVLAPLHMTETAHHASPEWFARIPRMYTVTATGLQPATPLLTAVYLPTGKFLSGGGNMLSTANDYLRFAQMLLNGGELDGVRLLKRETVALMTKNQLPPSVGPLRNDLLFVSPGYGFGFGFAVLVDSAASGLPGNTGMFRWWGINNTYFWIDPKADLIAMVLTQLSPGRPFPLEQEFQRLVYAAIQK